MTEKRTLRVFCPTHEAAFEVAESQKILCEITEHVLSVGFPNSEFWEFCCNCETFAPSKLDKGEKARKVCYGCGNEISRRFACSNCKTFCFESDAPTKGKDYFINNQSGIEPNCPGCRNAAQNGELIWHECPEMEAGFFTTRETCPFCLKKLSAKIERQKNKSNSPVPVICPQCGSKNPTDSVFCGECRHQLRKGEAVNAGTSENKTKLLGSLCPNCSLPMPPDASFCGECGQAVMKAIPPPPTRPPKKNAPLKTEPERKSFDTNVLDPRYAAQAQRVETAPNFNGRNAPAAYQNSKFTDMNSTSARKVEKVGLPEHILSALPYLPFWIGSIVSILELFFVPRNEIKVRFHAAQALTAYLTFFIVITALNAANLSALASLCNLIFAVAMIVWMVKAFQKKPIHIKFLDGATRWLDKKCNPRK